MGHRQKAKGMKRPRSWHRRFGGPDRALRKALKRIDRALTEWEQVRNTETSASETCNHEDTVRRGYK